MVNAMSDFGLPLNFWVLNGMLADDILSLQKKQFQSPVEQLGAIVEKSRTYRPDFMGHPTLAMAVSDLAAELNADSRQKVELICQVAAVSACVRDEKIACL